MAERRTGLAGGTGVALVEIAAGEDANAEGGEETGADGVEVDVAIGHDAAIGLDGDFVAPASAGQEGKAGGGGGTGDGQGADLARRCGGPGARSPRGNSRSCSGAMAKERRREVSKPGPLASRPVSVRRNRAAPMTRMREKATCRVTMHLRRRTPPKPVPARSRSEEIRQSRPAWRAGARPLRRPAARLARKAKASRRG